MSRTVELLSKLRGWIAFDSLTSLLQHSASPVFWGSCYHGILLENLALIFSSTRAQSSVMVSPSLFGNTSRQQLYVCSRCAFRASKVSPKTMKRWIGQKYLAKVAQAETQWQEWAREIRAKKKKSMLTILKERGLVDKVTGYAFSDIVIVLY